MEGKWPKAFDLDSGGQLERNDVRAKTALFVLSRFIQRISVGACVADTNARGQLLLILGTMHNFEEYAIVIQKNDGAIF